MQKYTSPRDWADMRVFQAIADHGSLSAAASALGLTQPSVGRRLADMEERLGAILFVRGSRRMEPTEVGAEILQNVRSMSAEMRAIERALEVQSQDVAGDVTITATEGIGSEFLAPELVSFSQQFPDLRLHIHLSNDVVNLEKREADIALRLNRPTEPELIGRKLVDVGLGLYASQRYLEKFPPITSLEQVLQNHKAVRLQMTYTTSREEYIKHFESAFWGLIDMPVALQTNSPTTQMSATRAGFGIGTLAHRWASMFPDLVPVLPGQNVGMFELWMVTHGGLRHSAKIRAVADFLADRFRTNKTIYEGSSPPQVSDLPLLGIR